MPDRRLNIRDVDHLSLRLDIRAAWLQRIADSMASRVYPKRIPKKDGSYREIFRPSKELKAVQKSINKRLLQPLHLPDGLHGSVPKRSVVTNARSHTRKAVVASLDIRDFYPSIHYSRVNSLFRDLGCSPEVARLLTRLTTYNHCLAQGFPTSQTIANLLLASFWPRIERLREVYGVEITSYQDDLTVSGGKGVEPALKVVGQIIEQEGLKVHPSKTKVMGRDTRQEVTGLVVNDRVNTPSERYRGIRSILYRWRKEGIIAVADRPIPQFIEHIRGRIEWVRGVNKVKGDKLLQEFKALAGEHTSKD